jgi:uncharacterized protein GlcG (DUF336 family)
MAAARTLLGEAAEREQGAHMRPRQAAAAAACAALLALGCRGAADSSCGALPGRDELLRLLRQAPTEGEAGGLFRGRMMWAAVVDRGGRVCALVSSAGDPAAVWPGSRAIAMAKAYTANAFSTDQAPLSTARLYTLSQPGHSLWGAGQGNPFDPACLGPPSSEAPRRVCGGTIVFGGGLPLYRGLGKVGGLGVSGDTACADHEIAKRVRNGAALNPPNGALADDITFSGPDGASAFTHPVCVNTWRNGLKIGDEAPAAGY